VETLGIKETTSAKFNIWQMITQSKEIALTSTSALGEFNNFDYISMEKILGEIGIAHTVTVALVALLAILVFFDLKILWGSFFGSLQRSAIVNFNVVFVFFAFFPFVTLAMPIKDTVFTLSAPTFFLIAVIAIPMISLICFDKPLKEIGIISAEILVSKYKNENKKWYETFIRDILEFLENSNASSSIEIDCISRFFDAYERNNLRENDDDNKNK
jgi:hypothetical protein